MGTREKLERMEELLDQLQKNFRNTYREMREILDSMAEEEDLVAGWEDYEEEVDSELLIHMEEIFGEEE